MAESKGPDLTLIEADIRGVATVVELVAELRKINSSLDRICDGLADLTVTDARTEKMVREIALGLGVPVP
jgi:hypothetical protein